MHTEKLQWIGIFNTKAKFVYKNATNNKKQYLGLENFDLFPEENFHQKTWPFLQKKLFEWSSLPKFSANEYSIKFGFTLKIEITIQQIRKLVNLIVPRRLRVHCGRAQRSVISGLEFTSDHFGPIPSSCQVCYESTSAPFSKHTWCAFFSLGGRLALQWPLP